MVSCSAVPQLKIPASGEGLLSGYVLQVTAAGKESVEGKEDMEEHEPSDPT